MCPGPTTTPTTVPAAGLAWRNAALARSYSAGDSDVALCNRRAAGMISCSSADGTATWRRHRPAGGTAAADLVGGACSARSAAELGSGVLGGMVYSPCTSYLHAGEVMRREMWSAAWQQQKQVTPQRGAEGAASMEAV
jgi:hypothetical protein